MVGLENLRVLECEMHLGQSSRWNLFIIAFGKLFVGEQSLTEPKKKAFQKWKMLKPGDGPMSSFLAWQPCDCKSNNIFESRLLGFFL